MACTTRDVEVPGVRLLSRKNTLNTTFSVMVVRPKGASVFQCVAPRRSPASTMSYVLVLTCVYAKFIRHTISRQSGLNNLNRMRRPHYVNSGFFFRHEAHYLDRHCNRITSSLSGLIPKVITLKKYTQ